MVLEVEEIAISDKKLSIYLFLKEMESITICMMLQMLGCIHVKICMMPKY